jgi:hypothetical protein
MPRKCKRGKLKLNHRAGYPDRSKPPLELQAGLGPAPLGELLQEPR